MAGTPYAVEQLTTPPNAPPAVVADGISGNFLRLATAPAPNANTIAFDLTDPGIFPTILADFDFRMSPGNGRADGLGFALLHTGEYGASGPWRGSNGMNCLGEVAEEPNFAQSLGIGFDIYKSDGEISDNHVSIHFNCSKLSPEYNVAGIDLGSGAWIHARVILRQVPGASTVSVILTPHGGQPVTVVDTLSLPGLDPYEARALWGARAGGLAADHDIDNLKVTYLAASSSSFSFTNTLYSVTQGDSLATVTVARTGDPSEPAQVQYSTTNGTAIAGQDFQPTTGGLSWASGDATPKSFTIPIINSGFRIGEPRFFSVSLANPTAGDFVAGPGLATITILDGPVVQDFEPAISGTPYGLQRCLPAGVLPETLPSGPTGRFLRLSKTDGANQGTIAFDQTRPGAASLIVADFDFRITAPPLGRADGFGFALLNVSGYGDRGGVCPGSPLFSAEEPNFTDSLGVGFDIYKSDGDATRAADPDDNHVSIHHGSLKAEFPLFPVTTEPPDFATGEWMHVQIKVSQGATSQVSVLVGPRGGQLSTIVDAYTIPGAVPYASRVFIGARSGGPLLNADHDFDNVRVQFLDANASLFGFSDTYFTATESQGGSVAITVLRSENDTSPAQVSYATADGTAHAGLGLDYIATSGTLTWAAGDSGPKTFLVPLLNDVADEGVESFLVSLGNPAAGAAPPAALVEIVDDERAAGTGAWSLPFHTEVVAVHMHGLPDGSVMFWPGDSELGGGHAFTNPRIWHPATGFIERTALLYNLFCSGHAFLPDGRLFVTGGHASVLVPPGQQGHQRTGLANAGTYDTGTGLWTAVPSMSTVDQGDGRRWYPTNTVLANGDVLVTSGEIIGPTINTSNGVAVGDAVINRQPQVWSPTASPGTNPWRSLSGAVFDWPLYPWMFLMPDGKVFHAGPQAVAGILDTAGIGLRTTGPTMMQDRFEGAAIVYGAGKVLVAGGSVNDATVPTTSVEVIDLNAANPSWSPKASMTFGRRYATPTMLPDGSVLITGGTRSPGFNNAAEAVYVAEIWSPDSDTWTTLAPMKVRRVYHSTAVLLPDGRVLVAGGGQPAPTDLRDNLTAEVFSPPYLFKGPRPIITSAPQKIVYGEAFTVATPDASTITAVNWIRLPSVTHTFNQNQGFHRLTFASVSGGLSVMAPGSPNQAPPGHYMMFLIGQNGVPSVAATVQINARGRAGQITSQ